MRRWLCIATFGFIVLSLPLWAQRRSGGGVHVGGGRGGGHSSGSLHAAGSFHNRGGGFGHSPSGHGRLGNGNRHRGFYGRASFFPYSPYAYFPYMSDFGWSSSSSDDQIQDAYADSYNPAPFPSDREESGRDVQRLNGKIDRLQADVEARNQAKLEPEPVTALVFRDQHVEEVRNYAISGGMLWVLNQQAAKKIPLAQLDLDATVRMNDERGVDFRVPEPALSIMIVR